MKLTTMTNRGAAIELLKVVRDGELHSSYNLIEIFQHLANSIPTSKNSVAATKKL